MDARALDAVVFPAVADIGPADADTNPASFDKAWANGVWVANGNLAIRHLGIPTVTVPMGIMADTGMPAGLTFAGRGWDDNRLLQLACAFEATGQYRQPPPRIPDLPPLPVAMDGTAKAAPHLTVAQVPLTDGTDRLTLRWQAPSPLIHLSVNGTALPLPQGDSVTLDLPRNTHIHSEWQPPYPPLAIALFADGTAAFAEPQPTGAS